MGFTTKDLQKLQQLGKIRGYTQQELKPVKVEVGGRKVVKHWGKKSEQKDWLYANVLFWANDRALEVNEEYVFHPVRKFKFDLLLRFTRDHKGVAIEWEGINSQKSRHTSLTGYSRDADKYREAAKMGITVLRYTILNYKQVLTDLNEIYARVRSSN